MPAWNEPYAEALKTVLKAELNVISLLPLITTSSPPVVVSVKLEPVLVLIPEPTTTLSLNVLIPLVIV